MKDILNWIITNREALIAILSSIYVIASIIVRLTPNTNDDRKLAEVRGYVSKTRNIIAKVFHNSKIK